VLMALFHSCNWRSSERAPIGGLDAPVGPGGATLFGGERRRIALARLFLRDSQAIVCDEYTASIDNATARLIRDALGTRFAGRTRIVVTLRFSSTRSFEQQEALISDGHGKSGITTLRDVV
jgi:ABC-type multidrug transport system fused ATPase/permease subunit